MDGDSISSGDHFHIQWEGFYRLDWECFKTRQAAVTRAKELARPDEQFIIVEVRGVCPPGGQRAAAAG